MAFEIFVFFVVASAMHLQLLRILDGSSRFCFGHTASHCGSDASLRPRKTVVEAEGWVELILDNVTGKWHTAVTRSRIRPGVRFWR